MSATIIVLPIIRVEHNNLDALEQRDREYAAQILAETTPPARTRPDLIVNNPPPRSKSRRGSRRRRS